MASCSQVQLLIVPADKSCSKNHELPFHTGIKRTGQSIAMGYMDPEFFKDRKIEGKQTIASLLFLVIKGLVNFI